jgi:zinc/manganese transport system permease protein
VIFVDLALAQIAALGAIVASIFGIEVHSSYAYVFALGFTFLGSLIFAFTRSKRRNIPQEAIIGIVYAITAAASILVLAKSTAESEHIKDMLVGNILFVDLPQIIKMAVLYLLVGIFHYIYRKNFIAVSEDKDIVNKKKINIRLWDFLFYASIGVVVTLSVEIAGVLLVFSYLIVPSICAIMLANNMKSRLLLGWTIGALTSLIGLYFSATYDFPTGAAIVCAFGAVLVLVWLAIIIFKIKVKK